MILDLPPAPLPSALAQAGSLWTSTLTLWQVLAVLLMGAGAAAIVVVIRAGRAASCAENEVAMGIARASAQNDGQLAQERDELERRAAELKSLMDDASEVVRLLAARMDEQASRLEALIARADAAIATESTEPSAAATARPSPDLGVRPVPAPVPRESRVVQIAGPRPEPAETLAARIFLLADQGLAPSEIARRVGQHVGKVELMLALRGRTAQRPARPNS